MPLPATGTRSDMPVDFKLPNLGEGVESGEVLSILVKEGDTIVKDQNVVELETDKATVEVPCPHAGTIAKIHVKEGDTVPIGGVLLSVEAAAAGSAPAAKTPAPAAAPAPTAQPAAAPAPAPPKPAPAPAVAKQPAAPAATAVAAKPAPAPHRQTPDEDDGTAPAAGPAIRRLARELGVDLARVRGTGEQGRILREDVINAVRHANNMAGASAPAVPSPRPAPAPVAEVSRPGDVGADAFGPIRTERASKIRRTIAERMMQSWTTIPQLTNFDDADVTELEKQRSASKDDYARSGIKLTLLPFIMKAAALSLRRHPVLNATFDAENGQIIYKDYVNLGMAVDTDRGLVVPVIRGVDRMNIPDIARALSQMAENVRGNNFSLDDLRGGSFTISNLGSVGGQYSTPIVNPGEVAILLPGRAKQLPVVMDDGEIEPRLILPLSISYDHRLVDGAAAARFLNEVIGYLESPTRLLLAP